MARTPKLLAPLYMDPSCCGLCTIISNINQMGYFHSHDYYEAFLVIEGSATHNCNGNNFELVKGSLVFVRSDDQHCYLQPISPDFQFVNVIIIKPVITQLIDYLGVGFPAEYIMGNLCPAQRNLSSTSYEPLLASLKRMIIFPRIDMEQYNTAFRLVVAEIFSHLVNENYFSEKSSYPNWIKHLITEMYKPENYIKSLDGIYDMAKCTPEHLSRSFRKYLNTSPSQFLNKIRIEEAARSIIYTDKPILRISEEVGFETLSHFYHLFKEQFHMSPNNYRKYSRQSLL